MTDTMLQAFQSQSALINKVNCHFHMDAIFQNQFAEIVEEKITFENEYFDTAKREFIQNCIWCKKSSKNGEHFSVKKMKQHDQYSVSNTKYKGNSLQEALIPCLQAEKLAIDIQNLRLLAKFLITRRTWLHNTDCALQLHQYQVAFPDGDTTEYYSLVGNDNKSTIAKLATMFPDFSMVRSKILQYLFRYEIELYYKLETSGMLGAYTSHCCEQPQNLSEKAQDRLGADRVEEAVQKLQGSMNPESPEYLNHLPESFKRLLHVTWPKRLYYDINRETLCFGYYDLEEESKDNEFFSVHSDYILIGEGSQSRFATTYSDLYVNFVDNQYDYQKLDFKMYVMSKTGHSYEEYYLSEFLAMLTHVPSVIQLTAEQMQQQAEMLDQLEQQFYDLQISEEHYQALKKVLSTPSYTFFQLNKPSTISEYY